MIGMQYSHTKLTGKRLIRLLIVCLVVTSSLLTGCLHIDELFHVLPNGYAVVRTNGKCVELIYNENWESETGVQWSGVSVLKKFYVKEFSYNNRYIGVIGTHTQETFATAEEISNGLCQYYLIDSEIKELYGPFSTADEFAVICYEFEIEKLDKWFRVEDYPDGWH